MEKIICSDDELSRLDKSLADAYRNVKTSSSASPSILGNQRAWLAARDKCPDRSCVKSAYDKRLDELRACTDSSGVTIEILGTESPRGFEELLPMSEAMKALLAMYALQAGTGCGSSSPDRGFQCALTQSLGFRAQCSDEQLRLVRSWFPSGIPKLAVGTLAHKTHINEPGSLEALRRICYTSQNTASVQWVWTTLRVQEGKNGAVLIDAKGASYLRGSYGNFRLVTEYRIAERNVTVVKSQDLTYVCSR